MKVKKQNFYFKSSNKQTRVHGVCWIPEGIRVKAVLQIAHGMLEFIDRYDAFARFLCSKGIAVVGNDHLGHGESVASQKDWGYMGENGFERLVDDTKKVQKHFKQRFPEVPYFLLGHSMGSFVARYYLSKYPKSIDGAIIMGTGYHPIPLSVGGQLLTRVMARVKGWHYRSPLVTKIAFGSYNKEIKPARTVADWLTRDEVVVDTYMSDPRCQFMFTLNGYFEMFKGIQYITNKKNIAKVSKKMPVLFISGDADPVGGYGEGVQKVHDLFVDAGVENVDMLLYDDARHEVLNELNRMDVYKDLYEWLNKEISLKH